MYRVNDFIQKVVKKAGESSKTDEAKFWQKVGEDQQLLVRLSLDLLFKDIDESIIDRVDIDKVVAKPVTDLHFSNTDKVFDFIINTVKEAIKEKSSSTPVPPPTPNKKIKVTFKGGEDALVDGQASKEIELTGTTPTGPVGLKGITWPTVTIKTEKASTKQRDGLKWAATGGVTGTKEQTDFNGLSSASDVVLTVVTKAKS